MTTTRIHNSFVAHLDPEASLAFYRDAIGFEVRMDVGYEDMRWITMGSPDQPDTAIVLHPPFADPGITADERKTITEMMAKGTFGMLVLASPDLDAAFAKAKAAGAEIVEEPTEQQWGVRDCSLRDPAGNMVKIQEQR
ncbi:MAG TPA: VOC family protein [Acidimicrobiales bacterium]|nr:VOC family protein [Acidimicrobiales bacterium]